MKLAFGISMLITNFTIILLGTIIIFYFYNKIKQKEKKEREYEEQKEKSPNPYCQKV